MKSELEAVKKRKYIGVAELSDEAARILAARGPEQERGTVTQVPDERTLRYYLTEGLISAPEEKQGPASVFGYLHLLQLLVVKQLQAEHLPIRKILELVANRSERQLERLLGIDTEKADSSYEARRYLESLLVRTSAAASMPAAPLPHQDFSAASPPLLTSRQSEGRSVPPASIHAGAAVDLTETWERREIEPGLELHVRASYQGPKDAKGLRRLANMIVRVIRSLG